VRDPYRIDRTLGTLFHIVERGGRPIMMTHVGRPKDKKTGKILCRPDESMRPLSSTWNRSSIQSSISQDFPLILKRGSQESTPPLSGHTGTQGTKDRGIISQIQDGFRERRLKGKPGNTSASSLQDWPTFISMMPSVHGNPTHLPTTSHNISPHTPGF